MRKFLLLGVAGAALALATASSQAAVLSYQVFDGASIIGSGSSASGGSLMLSGSDNNFSVSGGAAGFPFLVSPNFSTNNFNLVSSGAGVLTIQVTETGLTTYSGNIQNTFTLNSLTAPGFTTGTISNYFDASNAAYGMSTLLGTVTYAGTGSFSSGNATATSMVTPFSETTVYALTFAASGGPSSLSSSSQLIATPEPASMAILGASLAAVGFIRRRRA